MSRTWFSRRTLTAEAEKFSFKVHSTDDVDINGSRVLSNVDTKSYPITPVSLVADTGGGPITAMTVHGGALAPTAFHVEMKRAGAIGTITIPQFTVSAVTSAPTFLRISYEWPIKPQTLSYLGTYMLNNNANVGCIITIGSNTLTIQTITGAALVAPFGLLNDLTISFPILNAE